MKLFLDTTYFLPAIGISVRELRQDGLVDILHSDDSLGISEITLFELAAKAAKHVAAKQLSPERVIRGLNAIRYYENLTLIPIHDTRSILTSFQLRGVHNDYIDCLLLASAINHSDVFVTEDQALHNLYKEKAIQKYYSDINPNFKILTLKKIISCRN
ncbi:MAG: PIN domain-containing protein [Candidatus Ranarchaeia archaeon]